MQEILFNTIGILVNSIHQSEIGWYITIQDDRKISGGYKIFTSNNIEFEFDYNNPAKSVFDHWYENELDIPKGLKEWGREICWTSNQIIIEWTDDMTSWKWKRL